ncbi:MAG: recombinase family protein [Catalinimonas sp.]
MRVVLFTRVSSLRRQDAARQRSDLMEYADACGWEVVRLITERISASKTRNQDRPGIAELRAFVAANPVDKVVVTEVSRFGRRTSEVLARVEELRERRVSLHIMNYQLDTLLPGGEPNHMGQFFVMLLADMARMETETLSERIRSGQAEARRRGKHIGRRAGSSVGDAAFLKKHQAVVNLLDHPISVRSVARACNVSPGTVQKVKRILLRKNELQERASAQRIA